MTTTFECILTDVRGAGERRVGVITLNRPKQLNALNDTLMDELGVALLSFDADEAIGCIVVTGGDKAFAAGADIQAMAPYGFTDAYTKGLITRNWETMRQVKKPVIAAVAGFALGGGCELALLCDLIVASETAELGQPEITLGIIPGGGGTQRLARVLGKQRAMELVLTGRRISAQEAQEFGLVNVVAKKREWLEQAMELARTVARRPPIAARLAKQAVLAADEAGLSAGLEAERRLYELAMATEDRVEGMKAFLEKREPGFEGK